MAERERERDRETERERDILYMHALYFDAVKRQTEGERHTDIDFITYILFILCFYIGGRERERERKRERAFSLSVICFY